MQSNDDLREDAASPGFDTRTIAFPTDEVRVKDLQSRFRDEFIWDRVVESSAARGNFCAEEPNRAFRELIWAMATERQLAEMAYLSASQPPRRPESSRMNREPPGEHNTIARADLIRSLDAHYQSLGISAGIRQTIELARQFETQAAEQAPGKRR